MRTMTLTIEDAKGLVTAPSHVSGEAQRLECAAKVIHVRCLPDLTDLMLYVDSGTGSLTIMTDGTNDAILAVYPCGTNVMRVRTVPT